MLRLIELFEAESWRNLTVVTGGTLIAGRASLDEEAEALVFITANILVGARVVDRAQDVTVPLMKIDAWHDGYFELYGADNKKVAITLV